MKEAYSKFRANNILSVFNAVCENRFITRLQIAEKCHITSMTVGKIVDELSSDRIIREVHKKQSSVGRHSGSLYINRRLIIPVVFINKYKITVKLCGFAGTVGEAFERKMYDDYTFEDNISITLSNVGTILKNLKIKKIYGFGIVITEEFNIPAYREMLLSKFSKFYPSPLLFTQKELLACYLKKENNSAYYIEANEKIFGCLIFDGVPFDMTDITLLKNSAGDIKTKNNYSDFSVMLFTISLIISPQSIYIYYDDKNYGAYFFPKFRRDYDILCVNNKFIPKNIFYFETENILEKEAAVILRNKWFSEEFLGQA